MNVSSNGKIRLTEIEKVEVVPISVHSDSRGFVVFPFQEMGIRPDGLLGFHFVTVESGAVRGNHRHPSNIEYLLLLTGEWRVSVRNPKTGETETKDFDINSLNKKNAGADRPLLLIPYDWAHAIQNKGEETGSLICFYLDAEAGNNSPSDPNLGHNNRKAKQPEVESIKDTVVQV